MLPIRLKLYNFLPYRDPDPLYFDGITTACLTGHNGAGKSSILDAITWVLWGASRVGKTGDDKLIHAGQNEMYVELDFEQQGVVYRVRRARTSGKSARSTLDLLILQDGSGSTWQQNSGANLRETEARIRDLLKVDYDTFVASAFLQQGKADAFTTRTPAERKKVLSDILGIERWAAYEEAAKKRANEIRDALTAIEGQLRMINEELQQEDGLRRELASAQVRLEEAQAQLMETQARLDTVSDAEANLRAALNERSFKEQEIANRTREAEELRQRVAHAQAKIAEYEAALAQQEDVEKGYEELQQARQKSDLLGEALQKTSELERTRSHLEAVIAREQAGIESEMAGLRARQQELLRLTTVDLSAELAALDAQIAQLNADSKQREALQRQYNDLKQRKGELDGERRQLEVDGKKQRDRRDNLEKLGLETCPTCGQPLTPEHKHTIIAEWDAELQQWRSHYAALGDKLKTLEAEITTTEKSISDLGTRLARLPYLQKEQGEKQKAYQDAARAQADLLDVQRALEAAQQRLAARDFAVEAQAQLASVGQQLAQIAYSSQDHETLRQTLRELNAYEARRSDLLLARQLLPMEQDRLKETNARIQRLETSVADYRASLAQLEAQLPGLEARVAQYRDLQAQLKRDHAAFTEASGKVAAARQSLEALEQQKQRKRSLEQERDDRLMLQSQHEELKLAFGKKGVPAMIIESAIPELELIANDLLTRMTEGRMHLRLTTQRLTKEGDTAETLEIEIADELGTRTYEMYSGGEAFRINFALRVALSKLLARRAGANLQTLFIDEGFGTQDEEGRARLVEAINTVQEDFRMILVITHMEDLRDAFPAHIIVEKTPSGSAFRLQ
jgi:exonuclease SbcC